MSITANLFNHAGLGGLLMIEWDELNDKCTERRLCQMQSREPHWGARTSTHAGGAALDTLLNTLIFQLLLKLVGLGALLGFPAHCIELLH